MRLIVLLLVACSSLLGLNPRTADARPAADTCFSETNQCLDGPFLQFWQSNGATPVFGFAITSQTDETNRDTGRTYPTQWFQRNRFELHAENAPPYNVQLGRLGDDRLRQLGRDWQTEGREAGARDGCLWFAETGHNVCNQGGALGFRTYWQTHGLEFDGRRGTSTAESLALFGLPLTEPRPETNASGDTVQTQWFERARFEWHPNNPDDFKVLLGLLGSEVRAGGPARQPAPVVEYVALGDSLATGILAQKGYVERYKEALQADNGWVVSLTNLGRNGWTSAQLLQALRADQTFRTAVAKAQVLTFDIGGNDLRDARASYKSRSCGGADNQECLRTGVARFKQNWNDILAEIRGLRDPNAAAMRTMDIYNPYVRADSSADTWADDGGLNDRQVFKPYLDDANAHIVATAGANNISVARVYAAYNGTSGEEDPLARSYIAFDGLHPSDAGHAAILESLRGLGYAPLR